MLTGAWVAYAQAIAVKKIPKSRSVISINVVGPLLEGPRTDVADDDWGLHQGREEAGGRE